MKTVKTILIVLATLAVVAVVSLTVLKIIQDSIADAQLYQQLLSIKGSEQAARREFAEIKNPTGPLSTKELIKWVQFEYEFKKRLPKTSASPEPKWKPQSAEESAQTALDEWEAHQGHH